MHGLEVSSLDKPDGILESVERIYAIVLALPVPSEWVEELEDMKKFVQRVVPP